MDSDVDSVVDEGPRRNGGSGLYRLGSNHSRSTVFEDVEMAQDEVSWRPCTFLSPRRN